MKTQSDMISMFKSNQATSLKYNKVGFVSAKKAMNGEIVETILDGIVETTNTAKENDIIALGQKNETYLMAFDKFKIRYVIDKNMTSDYQEFKANGQCIAFEYTGENIEFMAPWHQLMIVNTGDFLATTDESVPEVYRIEREVFFITYEKA